MAIRRTTVLVVAAILLAALLFAVPALIDVDRYRGQVISYLQQKTGKQVEIGRLALSFFPLSIQVDGFGVKNSPLFPRGYVVQVARIDAGLDAAPLLHRRVVIKSLVLENPVIHLISDPDGPWNFENPQANSSQKVFPLGPIALVQIKRGEVIASNLLPSDAPGPVLFEAHDISSELANVDLDAILNPSSSSVDGQGTLKANRLRFGSVHATNVSAEVRLEARQIVFSNVTAETYGGNMNGEFVFKLSGKTPSFATKAEVHGIEMAHLLASFGNARGFMTGKMSGDLTLIGDIEHSSHPLAGMRGVGHVTVRNGEVPSLELNANLMKLMHFNDLGPAKKNPSSFNFISTDLQLANLRIASTKIDVDGYGVDIDGSGGVSVSGSNELDYRGTAQITTNQGFFTNIFGRLSGGKLVDGKLTFPFRITGTIQNPVFSKGDDD
ncbi:MAG TPA: AsmA family protein [Candidatus Acidoferrum sp.]|nr:AsmA family protein [Candidatus Acidoferrum sp.]